MKEREQTAELDRMWNAHRPFLRRLLISMARDIDLAEDLLQDTYVRARTGFPGYRGGDARGWLSAIARTTFLNHARRKYYSHERCELGDEHADERNHPGSGNHLDALAIRRALSDLNPQMRAALILKHYAGLTYDEIAEDQGCPSGTAKWRVNQAIEELRSALGISTASPAAAGRLCMEARILDYLYACLPANESAEVEAHIRKCPHCGFAAEELRSVMMSLDHIEGDRKMMHILEIGRKGTARLYVTFSAINESGEPWQTARFYIRRKARMLNWISQGADLEYTRLRNPDDPGRADFEGRLPKTVMPNERLDHLTVFSISRAEACAEPRGDGLRFEWTQRPSPDHEYAYVQAVRIPPRADLIRAEPESHEVRTHGVHTTVVWRKVLTPDERFSCAVEYSLKKR